MDDVVADFQKYATTLLGKKQTGEKWPQSDWLRLRENERLYRDLEKTKEADELVTYCRQFVTKNNYELMFLTAVPKGNDFYWSFYDKVLWGQKYFSDIPVMFGPYSTDKHVHCRTGDILVDDRSTNINEWRAAGGLAVQHKHGDLENTIKQLENIFKGETK